MELRNIIDKLAQFVARNGTEFEQMTMNKQKGNPKFAFLFGGEYYHYYQYRVRSEQSTVMGQDEYGPKFSQLPPPHMNAPFFPPPGQAPFGPFNAQFGPPPTGPGQQPPMLKPMHPFDPSSSFPQNNLAHSFPPVSSSQSLPLPPPMFQSNFPPNVSHPSTPPAQFNDWSYQQQPPPQMPPGQPPLIDSSVNSSKESNLQINSNNLAQITQIRESIAESEKNLAAQHKLIMEEEKEKRIEEMILKSLDDELKRMSEDFSINLNEFDKILQPIIDTCRKESIAVNSRFVSNKLN